MFGVIDIETTGFSKSRNVIIEVGIVGVDLVDGSVCPLFESVGQEKHMTSSDHKAWIFDNSDLTIKEVMDAPLFDDIAHDLRSAINMCEGVTAYNKKFDFGFLRHRNIRIDNELDCPMLLATNVLKIPNRNRACGYKWPKVQECWDYFFPDEPYVEKHRGLDDAEHEARIIIKLHQLGVFNVTKQSRS